ncbi:hypothetical protein A2853_02435 [Candidatus Kaiserbacteria bacterium RIFCSPHIGHO2_01_FULL_55_17]|uniref:Uncharacterized protein n=1 Tax=Candidatus Kaiserbacteria bacterium RIFCSPHIGHO2_01_FULL_55_17 TaxID=1798484 RepID=A0A1F6D7D9_9BACT|nr:MAG: hypothetical protein A2853_02435 [Candidatus Kaiserbacteria bacterium RIFCSPHIGHO2_01_FULL_55_17]
MGFEAISSVFSAIPTDWLIIGTFAAVAAFECFRSGAHHVAELALALPITALLTQSFPQTFVIANFSGESATPAMHAVLFCGLFVVLFVLISRIGLAWGDEKGQAFSAAIAGVSAAAIVVTIWVATPSLSALWQFGPQVQAIFSESFRFWWLLGSYGALAFIRNY